MYLLLGIIHIVFIVLSHLFGYFVLEWVFVLLFLYFIIYFSPLFFFKKEKTQDDSLSLLPKISPQNSILLPIGLFYTAIYLLLFALTGSLEESFRLHVYLLLWIYGIIFSYMVWFDWKNKLFFETTRIHTLLTYITIFGVFFASFFIPSIFDIHIFILLLVSLIFSFFFSENIPEKDAPFFLGFLSSILLVPYFLYFFFFSNGHAIPVFISTIWLGSILLFEIIPKQKIFSLYLEESRIYTLVITLLITLLSIVLSFIAPGFFFPLFIYSIFFFFVHIRFYNSPVFASGLVTLFFLYSQLFFPLLYSWSFLSVLMFLFFLPLCIIGNTYFWEEKHPHDMEFLHYSSIGFSILFSLYTLIFIGWWGMFLFLLSACIFGIGILFFLSYFRFHSR